MALGACCDSVQQCPTALLRRASSQCHNQIHFVSLKPARICIEVGVTKSGIYGVDDDIRIGYREDRGELVDGIYLELFGQRVSREQASQLTISDEP